LKHLKLFVGGHIHESRGEIVEYGKNKLHFVNASICTLQYSPTNSPIVVEI